MEEELQRKQEQKEIINSKYKPLVKMITDSIDNDQLDIALVIFLLEKHYRLVSSLLKGFSMKE